MSGRNGSGAIRGATYDVLDQPSSAVVMQHFDMLPKNVRVAIAKASFAYDPREIARRMAKGAKPTAIVEQIEGQDRRLAEAIYQERASA